MKVRRFVRSLPCKLTEEERRLKGIKLGEAAKEKADVEARKKDAAAGFRAELKDVSDRIQDLGEEVVSGQESRPVQCCERPGVNNMVEIFRVDTGVVFDTRPMTLDEQQAELFPVIMTTGADSDDSDDDGGKASA